MIYAGEAIEVKPIDVAPCRYCMRTDGVSCGDICRRGYRSRSYRSRSHGNHPVRTRRVARWDIAGEAIEVEEVGAAGGKF